jgi:cytochrome c oxidase subunit I+III
MIGARDLVYPRLSAYGYWCYLFGGVLLFSSLFVGQPPTTGWFLYVPLSSQPYSPDLGADFWLLGVTFAEISAVASAIELAVSILKTRAPGMTLDRMPLFVWAMLVTAIMIVFAFPPLILGGILLEVERAFGLPFYDPTRGGDALLWQHLFWLFGHPEVYLIFLPAAGIVSTIVPTFSRSPIAGYRWVVVAFVATAFLSFGLWVHHMYTTGIPLVAVSFFSAASLAVTVPAGIQVFAWISTLWNGRPVLSVPLLYVLGFLATFVIGGLTGVMLAMVPFDWQAHDTHFVVAHLHYVLFGGMVFPLFAALYYWLPLVSGRAVSETGSRLAFWLIFVGFHVTFLPMHVTGLVGMPRRVYTYPDGLGWETLNLVSTVGGFVTAIGVAALLLDLLLTIQLGRRAPPNVWRAGTLEWALPAPVPSYNFASQPPAEDRDPLWHDEALGERQRSGEFHLGHADATRREMLVTTHTQARPDHVLVLPGNTWLPLVAALFTGSFFIGVLVKAYAIALLGVALAVAVFIVWAWRNEHAGDHGQVDAGGVGLPLHYRVERTVGWWGTALAVLADAALFASLLFAFYFLWMLAPAWPAQESRSMSALLPAIAVALLAAGSFAQRRRAHASSAGLGVAAAGLVLYALATSSLSAKAHAYDALVFTVWVFVLVHVAIAVLLAAFVAVRTARVPAAARPRAEPAVAALFWHYTTAQSVVALLAVHAMPAVFAA